MTQRKPIRGNPCPDCGIDHERAWIKDGLMYFKDGIPMNCPNGNNMGPVTMNTKSAVQSITGELHKLAIECGKSRTLGYHADALSRAADRIGELENQAKFAATLTESHALIADLRKQLAEAHEAVLDWVKKVTAPEYASVLLPHEKRLYDKAIRAGIVTKDNS